MRLSAFGRAALPALFAALSLGCQKEQETTPPPGPPPVTPEDTSAIVDIEADGSGITTIEACIQEPNGLVCGRKKGSKESFGAESDGEKVPLEFQLAAEGSDTYEAGAFVGQLMGDATGKVIVVSWDLDAAFEATLPAPFDITEPTSASVFSLATDTITVKWAPSGEPDIIEWSYSGKCSNGNWSAPGGIVDDDVGELVMPAEGFSNLPPEGCEITIEVGRRRKGTVDTSKRDGFISAAQVRTATFTVKP